MILTLGIAADPNVTLVVSDPTCSPHVSVRDSDRPREILLRVTLLYLPKTATSARPIGLHMDRSAFYTATIGIKHSRHVWIRCNPPAATVFFVATHVYSQLHPIHTAPATKRFFRLESVSGRQAGQSGLRPRGHAQSRPCRARIPKHRRRARL